MTWSSSSTRVASHLPSLPAVGRYTTVWAEGRIPGGVSRTDGGEVGRIFTKGDIEVFYMIQVPPLAFGWVKGRSMS